MACSSCTHFLGKAVATAEEAPHARRDQIPADQQVPGRGICRRYPPRWISDTDHKHTRSIFPYVHRDQECGEYCSRIPL